MAYYPRRMSEQSTPRPPSPWARFTRPAPGERREIPLAAPPRPLHQTQEARVDPFAPAASQTWAPAAPARQPAEAEFDSYFAPADDDAWDAPRPRNDDPGHGLAVAAIVFGVFFAPLGLALGLVAARRSGRAGFSRRLALIGVAVAAVVLLASIVYGVSALDYLARLSATCAQLGAGEYADPAGRTVTCD
jgi:hypothetical protein